MEINDFLGIAIVGTILSMIVEVIKLKFGTSSAATKTLTLVLAIAFGTVYFLIRDTAIFATVLGILAAASTVYAFLMK